MGDIGGGLQAGASMVDTAATDATNVYLAQQNNAFNAQQAALQRQWSAGEQVQSEDFNAQQAALNRQFQAGQQVQAEDYNTQMANTAVQRRVSDLQAANINPLLAASQLGGASTPTMSAPSGSTASVGIPGGSSAQAAGLPRVDPVMAGMAQLRQTNAQTANIQQNTRKAGFETETAEYQADQWRNDTTPGMLMARTNMLQAQYGITVDQAAIVANTRNIITSFGMQKAGAEVQSLNLNNAMQQIQNNMAQMDQQAKQATLQEFIAMQNAVNTQATQEAKNVTAAQSGLTGKAIAYAQAVLTPVATASGAASSGASAYRALKTIPAMVP